MRQYPIDLTLTTITKRSIHNPYYLPKNIKHLVAFGNNSFIFGALTAFRLWGRDVYPDITFVYRDFWLDKAHSDYHNLDWGQTIYGLPRSVRQYFLSKRPNYPEERFIKWGEFQEVRRAAIADLQEYKDLTFHRGNPIDVKLKKEEYEIMLDKDSVLVPKDSFFYSWYRDAKKIPGIAHPHTVLYEWPRSEIPDKIIVLGHGVSVVWLLKHFPNTIIINIKGELREKLPEIPANKDVDIDKEIRRGRLKIYTLKEEVSFQTDKTGRDGVVISTKNGEVLHEAPIFAAVGLIPNHHVLQHVPNSQKIQMPLVDEKGNLLSEEAQAKRLHEDKFVSVQNIPPGSLAYSYTYLMEITRNIAWTSEPMFYFKQSRYEMLKHMAAAEGISLTVRFFDKIEEEIEKLENPLSPDDSFKLYTTVFEAVSKPNDIEVNIFKNVLAELFQLEKRIMPEKDSRESYRP